MTNGEPTTIAIDADDYHAKHVGKTIDGRQFFLATPFQPAGVNEQGCEYVALYTFDTEGGLIQAKIQSFGPRDTMNLAARNARFDELLQELGEFEFCRIQVAPFAVERFDTQFGLIIREKEGDDDMVVVEMQPGNFMAFFEPWDSGEYDT